MVGKKYRYIKEDVTNGQITIHTGDIFEEIKGITQMIFDKERGCWDALIYIRRGHLTITVDQLTLTDDFVEITEEHGHGKTAT